jgi:hypothetical protein
MIHKTSLKHILIILLATATISMTFIGCDKLIDTEGSPSVTSTEPADQATGVAINADTTATFNEEMDNTTIGNASFTLFVGSAQVSGSVTYDANSKTAKFNPAANLAAETTYTATVTTAVTDSAGNPMLQNKVWTFTTMSAANLPVGSSGGPGSVDLGTAADYAILAKSGVSTTGTTMVTGNIGLRPASRTELTGFSETMDSSGTFSTSSYVTGNLYAADYTDPTPTTLTTAISDMELAYTSAVGLSNPDFTNLGAGEIGGLTLEPGLYKWGTGVSITTDMTLWGSDTATWVFQVAEGLVLANGARITLAGGALAENIVWQIGSNASLGTTSHFEGTLLTSTNIPVNTGATVNGRLLAQTAVTLAANSVTKP